MHWFDSHCHLDDDVYKDKHDEVIQQCRAQGLDRMLVAGIAPQYFAKQVALCQKFHLDFALGLHPWFIDSDVFEMLKLLEQAIEQFQPRAIGECGLDQVKGAAFAEQQEAFQAQLKLAQKFDLPVIIHSVKAHAWVLAELKQFPLTKKGVIHGFNGSKEEAQAFIGLGFKLGIGPLVCRETARKLHRVVKHVPLDALILESDSPFSYIMQGGVMQPTLPLSIIEVAKKIASLRGITTQEVSEVTFESTCYLFKL